MSSKAKGTKLRATINIFGLGPGDTVTLVVNDYVQQAIDMQYLIPVESPETEDDNN